MSLGHVVLTLIVFTLAVGRVAKLISADVITDPIRLWIERRARNEHASTAERHRWGTLGYLVSCSWCTSMWIAFGFAWCPLYLATNPVVQYVAVGLAVSYVVGLLSRLIDDEDAAVEDTV